MIEQKDLKTQNPMVVDIKNKYESIKKDLIDNQKDVFLRYNYFTHKYKGNLLNDINVGLFINSDIEPVAQIFVRNKTGCIKTQLVFSLDLRTVINEKVLIYNIG